MRRLRSLRRRFHRDEQGLVILLWALGFLGLLAFLAMVVETGFVYSERRELQNTADASALAGAQTLWAQNGLAEADAWTWATKNVPDLDPANFNATVSGGRTITVTVGKNAESLFTPGHWLGFGRPLVTATATAQVAATRLPGPGVLCIGVEATSEFGQGIDDAYLYQQANPLPGPLAPPPLLLTPDGYYSVLRSGAGAGSNAGFVDIDQGGGGASQVRQCMGAGSEKALVEELDAFGDLVVPIDAEPGLNTGPARQGLKNRLEAAMLSGCYTWAEIRQSMLDADTDGDGLVDPGKTWKCSPLNPAIIVNGWQATSIVLLPVISNEFKFGEIQGAGETFYLAECDDPLLGCDPTIPPEEQPYLLAFFWLDAETTFVDPSSGNWQFDGSGGQGEAELWGIFLVDHPLQLGTPPTGAVGDLVVCNPGAFTTTSCFILLVR